MAQFTQGSSRLATLGFVAESLWDSTRMIAAWVLECARGFALLQTVPLADLRRSRHPKLLNFMAKRLPGWQQFMGTRGLS